ncbi:hypothetical protein UY3_15299 [Chelonia mydas]|uniref:Uncharacterized protein n=1 Tax=Chelonia mydas TaxID=8469 RepID=M7AQM9_CHEMY|nr:hypothetical protein UY3_15299 [Chelonia mydas]
MNFPPLDFVTCNHQSQRGELTCTGHHAELIITGDHTVPELLKSSSMDRTGGSITLDLDPVPPNPPKMVFRTLKAEKEPLVMVLHILLDNARSVYSAHNCRHDLSGLHVPSAMASALKKGMKRLSAIALTEGGRE